MKKIRSCYGVALSILLLSLVISGSVKCAVAQGEQYFFTLSLIYRAGDTTDDAIAHIVKTELAKIGINVVLDTFEWGTFLDRVFFGGAGKTYDEGGWDMHICYWIYDVADYDPRSVWHSSAISPNGYQPYGWKNGIADDLIERAEKTWNFTERGQLYKKFQEEVFKDHPYAFLYIPKFAYVMDPEIENFEPIETVRDLSEVTVRGKTEEDDITLIFAMGADVKNIGPVLPKDTWTIVVANNLYNALFKIVYDPETDGYKLAPDIAESYEISPDGLTMTVKLRDDVYFSDGVKLTSKDVKMTIDAHRTKETGSVRYSIVATALGDITERPDAVETPDDYTVVFHFKQVYAPFLALLADRGEFGIAPAHILDEVPREEWINHWMNTGEGGKYPVGTGPYKISKWVKDEYIELVPNEYYFGKKPFVDRWIIKIIPEASTALAAMENHEIDVLHYQSVPPAEVSRLENRTDLKVLKYLHPGFNGIGFNLNHPILNNVYVRWAISYAIPRDYIIEKVLHGMGASGAGPVPPHIKWAYNPNYTSAQIPYDLEKAKEYMEKAGYNYEWLTQKPAPFPYEWIAGTLILGVAAGVSGGYVIAKRKIQKT